MSDSGLFGPETVTWTVNRELVLLAGGGRALLLQVAHPLVAAGVGSTPTMAATRGELYRTLDLTTKIAFGDEEPPGGRRPVGDPRSRARGQRRGQLLRRPRSRPADVGVGDARGHRPSWLHGARARRPGAREELDRYHAEQVRFAEAFGVPPGHAPADPVAFRAYFDLMVGAELRVTDAARAVALRPWARPDCRRRPGCPSGRSGC